jgi:hypothetical protein
MADWKTSRWFRILTVDANAGVSFADLRFHRDLGRQAGLGVG